MDSSLQASCRPHLHGHLSEYIKSCGTGGHGCTELAGQNVRGALQSLADLDKDMPACSRMADAEQDILHAYWIRQMCSNLSRVENHV